MAIFKYGDIEMNYLKKKDKKLGLAIEKIGFIEREINPDLFSALINSIIGQQISTKAQKTIWERMKNGLGEVNYQNILARSDEEIQKFGISFKKASYIRGISERVRDGRLDIEKLKQQTDEEVCAELVKIPGIGVWTAEMLMLFSLERPDILSFGDLAILRGLKMLYSHKEMKKERFEKYKKRYSPYGSVASLYLWAIAGGANYK